MQSSSKPQKPAVVYLHGLASSPQSSKAVFFGKRFAEIRFSFSAPDLNQPEFRTLTLSRGIEDVRRAISGLSPDQDVILIGSSFGALTALHAYAKFAPEDRIKALILLAPAFDFINNREMSATDLARWKAEGSAVICHNNLPLDYAIVEDVTRYDSYRVALGVPCLVIHGRHDETIELSQSERFKACNPQVELAILEDSHQLQNSLELMWEKSNTDAQDRGLVPNFLRACSLMKFGLQSESRDE